MFNTFFAHALKNIMPSVVNFCEKAEFYYSKKYVKNAIKILVILLAIILLHRIFILMFEHTTIYRNYIFKKEMFILKLKINILLFIYVIDATIVKDFTELLLKLSFLYHVYMPIWFEHFKFNVWVAITIMKFILKKLAYNTLNFSLISFDVYWPVISNGIINTKLYYIWYIVTSQIIKSFFNIEVMNIHVYIVNFYAFGEYFIFKKFQWYIKLLEINSYEVLETFKLEINQRKRHHVMPINWNTNKHMTLNTHFPSYKSSVIVTVTLWQYWWWMSFILIILVFNRLLMKFFFHNTIKIEPKTYSSLKSNGRWGDAVASLFPVFWCTNILINSNYILRIIENHTESAVITIRIRGKQWYWLYKFGINFKTDLAKTSFIIGRGNKINVNFGVYGSKLLDTPIYINKWQNKMNKTIERNNYLYRSYNSINTMLSIVDYKVKSPDCLKLNLLENNYLLNTNKYYTLHSRLKQCLKHNKMYYNQPDAEILIYRVYRCHDNKLVTLKTVDKHKYQQYNRFWYTFQQQPHYKWKMTKKNYIVTFKQTEKINLIDIRPLKVKRLHPVNSERRRHFLRLARMVSSYNTLIVPTNTNMAIVTNSFDVVHSWFVPGLGIKFDCVPGRSTHYTLKITKPGIYYGHCAEVCGRFHHHMPIKICAVPFNQYIYYLNMYYRP